MYPNPSTSSLPDPDVLTDRDQLSDRCAQLMDELDAAILHLHNLRSQHREEKNELQGLLSAAKGAEDERMHVMERRQGEEVKEQKDRIAGLRNALDDARDMHADYIHAD